MPYVERDQAGAVAGLYTRLQPGRVEEFLEESHPEVLAFRDTIAAAAAAPEQLETLIEMLRGEDPAFETKLAAARQRIIDRRP